MENLRPMFQLNETEHKIENMVSIDYYELLNWVRYHWLLLTSFQTILELKKHIQAGNRWVVVKERTSFREVTRGCIGFYQRNKMPVCLGIWGRNAFDVKIIAEFLQCILIFFDTHVCMTSYVHQTRFPLNKWCIFHRLDEMVTYMCLSRKQYSLYAFLMPVFDLKNI